MEFNYSPDYYVISRQHEITELKQLEQLVKSIQKRIASLEKQINMEIDLRTKKNN